MTNHQLLDNVTHKDLRIIADRGAAYGDDVACTGVFPVEFRRLQAEYPIVFRNNATPDKFEPVVMFGFAEGENLFLSAAGWDASYIPLTIARQPFLIGFQTRTDGSLSTDEPLVHIDMDSPRVSATQGQVVFLEHGGYSPYLEQINSILMAIHAGHNDNQGFSDALVELNLLEPFSFQVELNDGSEYKLAGFYTIREEQLNALAGDSLARLHTGGYLEHIYMALASLSNFKTLIDRKNERL